MEGIRHDAMLATLGGILALLLGLGLMGLPLLAQELSRPRDALWGAVVLLLGLVLVTSADRLVGAPMVAVLCGGLLIGRLGSEVALSRWRVLSPEEQQRLWSLERWQTSLQQLLVVLGALLGRLSRAVTGLMEWLRERRQSRSSGKRWVRQEEPEASAGSPEAEGSEPLEAPVAEEASVLSQEAPAEDATQTEDSPAAESAGEDAAALEGGGVEAAGGNTSEQEHSEHDSAPEACASEEDSPPEPAAGLNDSAEDPVEVSPTVDESAAEDSSDLSSAEAVGVDDPGVEDPAIPEAARPEPPSAEPASAEPGEPVTEETESPAESPSEPPEAPVPFPEASAEEEERNEDSNVPEVRNFEEVDALLRAAPEAP